MNTQLVRGACLHRIRSGCVALSIAFVTAFLSACSDPLPVPNEDPFYTPPSVLNGFPGDLIDSRSIEYSSTALMWQILYQSTDASGSPMAVSGTLLVPNTPWEGSGARPLVTYAVGTRGVGDACAPSYTLAQGFDYERGFLNNLLDEGWAVVVTDYEGLGTPGIHTYMVGSSQGHAVLDAARASFGLDDAGLDASAPIGIMGYSQGGSGAGWAAQLAATYAPDLNVVGTAAGGVPADLKQVADFLDGRFPLGFMLITALGFDTAFPELDLESYLNDRGRDLFETSADICLTDVAGISTFAGAAFKNVTDYVTDLNPLEMPDWLARLDENKLGAVAPSAPVFQYHAAIDEIIPLAQAEELRDTWCALGGDITWRTLWLAEHAIGIQTGHAPGRNFLKDRFEGLPTENTCP